MKILISEFMDEAAVASLRTSFDTTYDATLVDRGDELLASLKDADALIVRNRTQVNAQLLAAAPRLKAVGRLGVGLDNIDLPACKARNVAVIPATGANALAVAEYVIATAMLLLRGAYLSTPGGCCRAVAARPAFQWPRDRRQNPWHRRHRRHRPTHGTARTGFGHAGGGERSNGRRIVSALERDWRDLPYAG